MVKNLIIYSIVSIGVIVCITYTNITIPICSLEVSEENILSLVSMVTIFLLVIPLLVFLALKKRTKEKRYVFFLFFIFFSSAPIFWSTMNRTHNLENEYFSFIGLVEAKYVSKNHAAKSLTIKGTDYEFIPLHIWKMIDVGDKVNKSSCSSTIEINNEQVQWRLNSKNNRVRSSY